MTPGVTVGFRQDSNHGFYAQVAPSATPNPTEGYMTLHHVPSGTDEARLVVRARGRAPALILRVQNCRLFETLREHYRCDPDEQQRGGGFMAQRQDIWRASC